MARLRLLDCCVVLGAFAFGGAAVAQCGTSTNDCCVPSPNHTTGCANAACCMLVCNADPYCCQFEWDVFCSNAAYKDCAACGPRDSCGQSDNSCCEPSPTGTSFCNWESCCDIVCKIDPPCCTNEWDAACASQASVSCWECDAPFACGVSPNDCCDSTKFLGPYCSDADCCEAVCAVDPTCCSDYWDFSCAYVASFECDMCGPPCVGDLFVDGIVNGADLGQFLGSWGITGEAAADFNDDSLVNGADLGILLGNWGPCK